MPSRVVPEEVDLALRKACFDIGNRFEITFIEIGVDRDHVYFSGTVGADVQPVQDRASD